MPYLALLLKKRRFDSLVYLTATEDLEGFLEQNRDCKFLAVYFIPSIPEVKEALNTLPFNQWRICQDYQQAFSTVKELEKVKELGGEKLVAQYAYDCTEEDGLPYRI